MITAFDDLQLDLTLYELRRDGQPVPMEPQAFDVLVHLVTHRDRVVSKEELMDSVWGGRFVTEGAVTSRIKQVRRAVGDDGAGQRIIRTVHGRGYRFVADVTEFAEGRPAGPPLTAGEDEPIRYTVSDGLQIAYQITGQIEAPQRDIVLVAGFISHLQADWGDAGHDRFLTRLGQLGRLIRFDKRGSGMSDRPPGMPDLETRMHDVLAVMDEADVERAVLFGYSEGGPMAALFAAAHPERVSALVLYGSYSRGLRAPDYPWGRDPVQRAEYIEHLVTSWDWESDLMLRAPASTEATARWWGRRMRASATPTTVRALMKMNDLVDIRDVLPAIRVPTLVLHRTGDGLIRIEAGRYLASRIRGAVLIELDGENHLPTYDPDQILDPIEDYIEGLGEQDRTSLALVAMVAVAMDDAELAEAVAVRLAGTTGLVRHTLGGPAGDAVPQRIPVVLFDGPATAVRAALRLLRRERERRAGEQLPSIGVQIAEVARDQPELSGFGVATAVSLARLAPPGELRASGTVHDLLAGSGVELEPAGVLAVAPGGRQPVFGARP